LRENKYVGENYSVRYIASESDRLQSAVLPAVPVQPPYSPLPHLVQTMTEPRSSVAALARARKSCKEIKTVGGCGVR
jgi:hypothetical protein